MLLRINAWLFFTTKCLVLKVNIIGVVGYKIYYADSEMNRSSFPVAFNLDRPTIQPEK